MLFRSLLGMVFGIVCLAPVGASADFIVGFDLDLAQLDYVNSNKTLTVTESSSSDLLVTHEDDGLMLDGAKISGGVNFDFNFTLSVAKDPREVSIEESCRSYRVCDDSAPWRR